MDYFLFNFSGVQFHYTMSHLVNANKDTIYADCREQAAYEEDEDYEE